MTLKNIFSPEQEACSLRERIVLSIVCLLILGIIQSIYSAIYVWIRSIPEVIFVKKSVQISIYTRILYAAILGPIYEEMIFRLPLRFKINYISISIILAVILVLLNYEVRNIFLAYDSFFVLRLSAVLAICVLYGFVLKIPTIIQKVEKIGHDYFLTILFSLVLTFSLAHFGRFKITAIEYYFIGVIILFNYFVVGLLYSYVRLRIGMLASIIFHILNNSIPYLITLYASVHAGVNYFEFL